MKSQRKNSKANLNGSTNTTFTTKQKNISSAQIDWEWYYAD
ncbi:MAG: hypothetical protein ABI723_01475 [Bacteroidia bacterium]